MGRVEVFGPGLCEPRPLSDLIESDYIDGQLQSIIAANGMSYNMQDLAQPPYFGAPSGMSLSDRATFQGTALSVCKNGP